MVGLFPVCIILMSIYSALAEGTCEDNWIQYHGSCYHVFGETKEWVVAVSECEEHKGHLVSIETTEENEFVKNYTRHQNLPGQVWIGATDIMVDGEFRWAGTDNRLTFSDWAPGEPNNYLGVWENCVELEWSSDYMWNDDSCEKKITICVKLRMGTCEDNWIQYHGSCYHLFQETKEWVVAIAECENHKGHLVSIETTEENDFVKNYAQKQSPPADVWIGANDIMLDGEFRWAGTDNRLNFTDWYQGEPNNYRGAWENCVELEVIAGYNWNDESCEKGNHYMCETSNGQQASVIG